MSIAIAYLVHDLGDAAVARRIEALQAGGARVTLAGFYRRAAPARVADAPARALGRSEDGRLGARALLVLRTLIAPGALRGEVARADLIIARNLEMLLVAAVLARGGQRIVYECLDIHRTLLGTGLAARVLRFIERRLLARSALTIVSSPAFERDYFRARQGWHGPITLVENKVAALPEGILPEPAEGGPWVIGWFGMLRCRRSLTILSGLAARSQGRVRVLIAGIPSPDIFPDFPAEVARLAHVEYVGPYKASDLPRLYGRVHFAWCIDYFEEGLNSRWLLPNRLYESLAHGAVPVALEAVETGRWLAEAGVGLSLAEGEDIAPLIAAMTPARHAELAAAAGALPRHRIAFSPADHRRLVAHLETIAA